MLMLELEDAWIYLDILLKKVVLCISVDIFNRKNQVNIFFLLFSEFF